MMKSFFLPKVSQYVGLSSKQYIHWLNDSMDIIDLFEIIVFASTVNKLKILIS